ncbi:MAG TPA: glycerophosphodiester phosphodiesterase family protein [Coleofasciculaceae cyanobacterium]|jgi:glycerophosphoryl diester phosphodiesterase
MLSKPSASCLQFGKMGQSFIVDHRGAQIRHARPEDQLPAHKKFVIHPENTLASIEESMRQGRALELDVNANGEVYTRNGKTYPYLPVCHDDHIGRPFKLLNPKPETRLRYLSTEDIQTAKFDRESAIKTIFGKRLPGIYHPDHEASMDFLDESPAATRIPALDEVFELLQQYPKSHVYVELKTLTQGHQEDSKDMEKNVVQLVKDFGVEDQVTIISFNPFSLKKVKQLAKKMGLKELTTAWDIEPNVYLKDASKPFSDIKRGLQQMLGWAKQIQVDALLPSYEETRLELVDAAHQVGLKVFPWVYHDDREGEITRIPALKAMGVDGVITNVPDDAAKILSQNA